MEIFNNRELAILIWLGIFAAWGLWQADVRKSLVDVYEAFFQWKIQLAILFLAIYIALALYGLSVIGLWDVSQLKNTILWTALVGFVSMFRVASSSKNPSLFRAWIGDNLKIILLVEFIANFYTFHIFAELIMVPILFLIGALLAITENRKEYYPAANFLNGLISILAIALIVYALYQVFADIYKFASLQTAQDLYTPPLLSLVLIPFLLALYIYVSYDYAFSSLQISIPDRRLRAFIKFQAIMVFKYNIEPLRRWLRDPDMSDKDTVRRSMLEARTLWKREKNPPVVAPTEGWSPYAAAEFLHEMGLVTGHYHRSADEWLAVSSYHGIGNDFPKNSLTYWVEGDEHAATRLELALNVINATDRALSEKRFCELAIALSKKALGGDAIENDIGSLLHKDHATLQIGDKEIRLSREDWSGGSRDGYDRRFVIEHLFSPLMP